MKEYKELKVPETEYTIPQTATERQGGHCSEVKSCYGISCLRCLFDFRNIYTFKQWEKEQNNEG